MEPYIHTHSSTHEHCGTHSPTSTSVPPDIHANSIAESQILPSSDLMVPYSIWIMSTRLSRDVDPSNR